MTDAEGVDVLRQYLEARYAWGRSVREKYAEFKRGDASLEEWRRSLAGLKDVYDEFCGRLSVDFDSSGTFTNDPDEGIDKIEFLEERSENGRVIVFVKDGNSASLLKYVLIRESGRLMVKEAYVSVLGEVWEEWGL